MDFININEYQLDICVKTVKNITTPMVLYIYKLVAIALILEFSIKAVKSIKTIKTLMVFININEGQLDITAKTVKTIKTPMDYIYIYIYI